MSCVVPESRAPSCLPYPSKCWSGFRRACVTGRCVSSDAREWVAPATSRPQPRGPASGFLHEVGPCCVRSLFPAAFRFPQHHRPPENPSSRGVCVRSRTASGLTFVGLCRVSGSFTESSIALRAPWSCSPSPGCRGVLSAVSETRPGAQAQHTAPCLMSRLPAFDPMGLSFSSERFYLVNT